MQSLRRATREKSALVNRKSNSCDIGTKASSTREDILDFLELNDFDKGSLLSYLGLDPGNADN